MVRSEVLWANGSTRDLREQDNDGGSERSLAADGTLRHEAQWQWASGRHRLITLDREFHESGPRIRERRWRVVERGGQKEGELASDSSWYLNGQPKESIVVASGATQVVRTVTRFHDNGVKAGEGSWVIGRDNDRRSLRSDRPIGSHRGFDAAGHLRAESVYDDAGKLKREREFEADGTVLRDAEVFEDGSRKAVGAKRGLGT